METDQDPERLLIVTADDVGLHRSITEAAITCHIDGVVTACSVVACGQDFDHAAGELSKQPRLAVGVHLTLVELAPLADPDSVESLVGHDGRFLKSWGAFVLRFIRGGVRIEEVAREFKLQIERVKSSGIKISHLNSHQHLHVLPGIREVVANLAIEHGIGYIRIPADRWAGRVKERRAAAVSLLAILARRARRCIIENSILRSNDVSLGVADAGHLDLESMCRLLPLGRGITELIAHPGMDNRELATAFRWAYDWQREAVALRDPRLRCAIEENKMRLVNPTDLHYSST